MKELILFTIVLFSTFSGFSQDKEKPKDDTTRIKVGNSTLLLFNNTFGDDYYDINLGKCDTVKVKKKEKKDMISMTMDIGTAGYMAADYNLNMPSDMRYMKIDYTKSRSVAFTMSLRGADMIKNRLYLLPGIGVSWNKYLFKNAIDINAVGDTTFFTPDSLRNISKYKLRTTYVEIPLLLGARIGNLKRPLGIQAGVVGSLNVGSIIKEQYSLNGGNFKTKRRDDFNITPFRFDVIARVTIGNIGVYGRYSLTRLFEYESPEVYPFSIGLTVGNF